jgi:hypothetical protein
MVVEVSITIHQHKGMEENYDEITKKRRQKNRNLLAELLLPNPTSFFEFGPYLSPHVIVFMCHALVG